MNRGVTVLYGFRPLQEICICIDFTDEVIWVGISKIGEKTFDLDYLFKKDNSGHWHIQCNAPHKGGKDFTVEFPVTVTFDKGPVDSIRIKNKQLREELYLFDEYKGSILYLYDLFYEWCNLQGLVGTDLVRLEATNSTFKE